MSFIKAFLSIKAFFAHRAVSQFLRCFQVVIILWSEGIANVSRLQYLVLVTLLLKAAYAPAAENARARKERENRTKWRCLEDG